MMRRQAFTLIELLVAISIIGLLLAITIPSIHSAREAARRRGCQNNLKQIGLAIHNYESAFRRLPTSLGGTTSGEFDPLTSNRNYLGGLVALLPQLERQAQWDTIRNVSEYAGMTFPSMGPAPWVEVYEPWRVEFPVMRCPTDPAAGKTPIGRTNYAFCVGDAILLVHSGGRNEVGRYDAGHLNVSMLPGSPLAGIKERSGSNKPEIVSLAATTNRGFVLGASLDLLRDVPRWAVQHHRDGGNRYLWWGLRDDGGVCGGPWEPIWSASRTSALPRWIRPARGFGRRTS